MMLLLRQVVPADTTQAVVDSTLAAAQESTSILDTLIQGGWVMVPIILLSFFTIYIFIERLMTLRRAQSDRDAVMDRVRDYVQAGDIHGATAFCESHEKPLTRILTHGLERLGRPISEIGRPSRSRPWVRMRVSGFSSLSQ